MNRREFILSAAGAAMAGTGCVSAAAGGDGIDDTLSVFLSDVHVCPSAPEWIKYYDYTRKLLTKRVDQILAMRPRPCRVVTFGDLCFNHGEKDSYEFCAKEFKRLTDAGIRVFHGMGNHDRRKTFLECFPEFRESTPVPGRIVSVVNMKYCDLILLDTLKGRDDEYVPGAGGPVEGELNEAQQKWLAEKLPKWERPVIVAAHHHARELTVNGRKLHHLLRNSPKVVGYVHGHEHTWMKDALVGWGSANTDVIRLLTLPSSGLWGDIGYVVFRDGPESARAELVEEAYWFNRNPQPGEKIPDLWREIVEENRGQRCTFPYQRVLRKM